MKKNNIEDTIHIQKILDNDKKSEQFLYKKYKKLLIDFIKTNYPQNQEYEDDVAEILIKIFTSLSKYDANKSQFKSWVFTIAKNYMIDKMRCKNKNDNCTINLTTYNYICTTQNTPSTSNFIDNFTEFNSTNTNIFESCVSVDYISNQLDSCDFTFLNMHYGYGYSYSEIGNEFNITSNTVSNRVNYVKNKLKRNNINEIIF